MPVLSEKARDRTLLLYVRLLIQNITSHFNYFQSNLH